MNKQSKKLLEEGLLALSDLLEQRNFNSPKAGMLLIGTPEAHRKMIKLLKENPSMSEEEFLKEAEKIEEAENDS